MANQPDEARPPKKDDTGPVSKPDESKETPVTSTGDTTPPAAPAADPHSMGEGAVLVDRVEPGTAGTDPHPQDEYNTYDHGHHAHDHDYHHDDPHHNDPHHYDHGHDQGGHDDFHRGEEQGSGYGGGTPAYAAAAVYGGGSGGGGSDRPEGEGEDDEGGPIKSFLDHLEDLRWMLIKCSVAVGVGMLLCLIAGDFIMQKVLLRPLKEAEMINLPKDKRLVTLMVGTNTWGTFRVLTNHFSPIDIGSNRLAAIQIVTVTVGTNQVLALAPSTNPPPSTYQKLLNLGPVGGFYIAFQLAIYGGIVLASPLVIYYIAQFLLPALKVKEKKYVLRGFAVGTGLFMMGVSFCYFILMPFALNASARYSEWLGISADQWTAELYISFVCKFMLGMGLGFELPVVVLTLVKIGIVGYKQLAAFRRYMIVINLVLGAVLTTPEVLTQVMMAIPLQILYEISVWIAWYWERQAKKRQAAQEAT
jgi:sec-independent protein translocase protein TatC